MFLQATITQFLQQNTIYPGSHAKIQEFLQPGCTYELYVWDENGSYAQQQFTLPGKIIQINKGVSELHLMMIGDRKGRFVFKQKKTITYPLYQECTADS